MSTNNVNQFTLVASMRVIVLSVCLLALAGCGDTYRYVMGGEVGWNLKKEIRDKGAKEINLAKLVPFAWDELFLFGPYQPTEAICAKLGLSPTECKSKITKKSTDDSEMLMVFLKKGQIAHVEMHYLFHGDFIPNVHDQPLTPETALFVVTTDGKTTSGKPWLRLKLKDSAIRSNSRLVSDTYVSALSAASSAPHLGR